MATYTAGGDGLDIRGDLGTLNLSDVPTVLVELGNMRSRIDARRMSSRPLPVAKYIAGGDGLDIRSDLGTLNLSDVPTVMVELGNMRNRVDAHRMTSRQGQARYARALAAAAYRFLR